jgi:hypothetical protein
MSADPEAQARAWTRQVVVNDLSKELHKAAGVLESGVGLARTALANPLVDEPELAERKGRLLGLLRDGGALLVLEQTR